MSLFVASFYWGWLSAGDARPSEAALHLDDQPISWTGWYVGLHGGYLTGSGDLHIPFTTVGPPSASADLSELDWGVHGGARHQLPRNIVAGLEIGLADGVSDKVACTLRSAAGQCEVDLDWEQSITGTLGLAWRRFLVSGKLGVTIAETQVRLTDSRTPGIASAKGRATTIAETYGAVIEYAARPWLTFGLEWDRSDYDVKLHHLIDPNGVHVGSADLHVTSDVVRVRTSIKCCNGSPSKPDSSKYMEPFSWTGGYFGVHSAYFLGDGDLSTPVAAGASADPSGFAGGLHGGARYQFANNLVAGLDYALTRGVTDKIPCTLALATGQCEVDFDWEQSVTARLGYARGRLLISANVGASLAETIVRLKNSQTPGITFANSSSETLGVKYGAAVEYAVRPWWTLGVALDRADYEVASHTLLDRNGAIVGTPDLRVTNDVLGLRSSFKF